MRTYFFGVISADQKGHFLYDSECRPIWGEREERQLPFRYTILDGGLLPVGVAEEQGKLHLAVINGWTVLGMWDRSADKRGACNASFIAEGVHTMEDMKVIAATQFPKLWSRIQNRRRAAMSDYEHYQCDCGRWHPVGVVCVIGQKQNEVAASMGSPKDGVCWCEMCGFNCKVPATHRVALEQDHKCPWCDNVGDFTLLNVADEFPEHVIQDEELKTWPDICDHEFDAEDLPCAYCGKTAKELGLSENI